MSDDQSLEAILAPQDVAELSETTDAILAHPMPSPEAVEHLRALHASSPDRIEAMMDEPGELMRFDLTTQQGHIDAVTYIQSVLLGAAATVREAQDRIEVNETFETMHEVWAGTAPAVQFNVLLNVLDGFVGMAQTLGIGEDQA